MTIQQPYTYTILRYVHDVTTGEFVNVGVVMHLPREGRLLAKARTTIGRMRGACPDLDRAAFTSTMRAAQRALDRIAKRINLFRSEGDASYYACQALPTDDSSLQWSPLGCGLTNDAEKTFARLYERFDDTPCDGGRARRALNLATIEGMSKAFEKGGQAAIDKVMKQQPAIFLKMLVLLVPRELEVSHSGAIKNMTDEQIEAAIEAIQSMLAKAQAGSNAKVIEAQDVVAKPDIAGPD